MIPELVQYCCDNQQTRIQFSTHWIFFFFFLPSQDGTSHNAKVIQGKKVGEVLTSKSSSFIFVFLLEIAVFPRNFLIDFSFLFLQN